jgi:hypothetical protein
MKPIPIKSPKKKKKKINFQVLLFLVFVVIIALYFMLQKQEPISLSLDKQCKAFKLIAIQKAELKIRSQSLNNYIIDKTIFAGEEIRFGDSKGVEIELQPVKSAILIYGNKELDWNQLFNPDKKTFSFKCY